MTPSKQVVAYFQNFFLPPQIVPGPGEKPPEVGKYSKSRCNLLNAKKGQNKWIQTS